jgi:polygalacturonase
VSRRQTPLSRAPLSGRSASPRAAPPLTRTPSTRCPSRSFHSSGNGATWWPQWKSINRPDLLLVQDGTDVLIKDVTVLNSPNHNLEIFANNIEVVGTTVLASPPAAAHNTDGIDVRRRRRAGGGGRGAGGKWRNVHFRHRRYPHPHSFTPHPQVHGSPAWVHDCHFSVGDDNLALHASDFLGERNTFGAGHGASIGSLGGAIALSNITVRDTSFNGTTQAIRIKSDVGASG